MGAAGGFASKPGGGSLVQVEAEGTSAMAPGKRTLVEQAQPAAGLPGGGGAAAASVQQKEKKKHANGGFSKYGGPSVREYLTQMVEQGKLQISGKQIALLDAVAQVETGGKIGCVQTYDNQIVSVGFKQVVLGHGSLEKIMKKAPAGFARHGLVLDTSKKYTHPGWSNHPSQIAGCEDENELRKPEWGMKFYDASMEPDVVAAMVELALGEAGKVEKAVAKHAADADRFADPTAQGWLLETYNNRPAFMPIAIRKAIAYGARSADGRDAFLDILARAIVDTYVEQEPLLHYRKAKQRKGKLSPEQDASLLEEARLSYEAVGRRKGTNIVTKIKRTVVIPKLDGDQAQDGQAAPAEAPASAPALAPAHEVLMSMPAPELESMAVEPDAPPVCLPENPGASPSAEPASAPPAGSGQAAHAQPSAGAQSEPAQQEPDWSVRARAYHREHPAMCEQFIRATNSACVGPDGELDPAAVAHWQAAHDVKPDGRVGPQTVQAAIREVESPPAAAPAAPAPPPPTVEPASSRGEDERAKPPSQVPARPVSATSATRGERAFTTLMGNTIEGTTPEEAQILNRLRYGEERLDPRWLLPAQTRLGVVDATGAMNTETLRAMRREAGNPTLDANGIRDRSFLASIKEGEPFLEPGRGFAHEQVDRSARRPADRAAQAAGYASYRTYKDSMLKEMTFLGVSLQQGKSDGHGHPHLVARVQAAEAYLRQRHPGSDKEIAKAIGWNRKGGASYATDAGTNMSHMHTMGLAIDIDSAQNPFIFAKREDAKDHKFWKEWFETTFRNASRVFGGVPLTAKGMMEMSNEMSTEELGARITETSQAFTQYLKLGHRRNTDEQIIEVLMTKGRFSHADAEKEVPKIRKADQIFHGKSWETSFGRHWAKGITNISMELLVALRDVAGLAWGGTEMHPHENGDFMHFDCRHDEFGSAVYNKQAPDDHERK